jgi:NADH dehydrogenase FAD-containing subunit
MQRMVILGAGFGGVQAAIELERELGGDRAAPLRAVQSCWAAGG